jgi:processing peptidase subunit beta
LDAYTPCELTVYYANCFRRDVPTAVDVLNDMVQNMELEPSAIEKDRGVRLKEQEKANDVQGPSFYGTAFNLPLPSTLVK